MLDIDHAKSLDHSIDRLGLVLQRIEERQNAIEGRVQSLYHTAAVALAVIVVSITLLVVVLSYQLPHMTTAMIEMNDKFSRVSKDMAKIDLVVADMNVNMQSLPQIISHVDRVNSSLVAVDTSVSLIGDNMLRIDNSLGNINASVRDMRGSFHFMEGNVARMGRNTNHLSQPMRMFNWFNPFN
jgi:methyl-accepting chemotaxis protein